MNTPSQPPEDDTRTFVVVTPVLPLFSDLPTHVQLLNEVAAAFLLAVLRVSVEDGLAQRLDVAEAEQASATPTPGHEGASAVMRRLRERAPGLHGQVMAGELTMHEAAVTAGLRSRYFQTRSSPRTVADTIRRRYSFQERQRIGRWLLEAN
jgi:hypothetical protein